MTWIDFSPTKDNQILLNWWQLRHIYSCEAAERWSRTLNVLKDETRIVEGTKVWRHILFWNREFHVLTLVNSLVWSHFSTRTCCSLSSVVVLVRSSTYSKSELNPRVLHWVEVWPPASLADSQLSLLPHYGDNCHEPGSKRVMIIIWSWMAFRPRLWRYGRTTGCRSCPNMWKQWDSHEGKEGKFFTHTFFSRSLLLWTTNCLPKLCSGIGCVVYCR